MTFDMIDVAILTKVEDRPAWLRSLQYVKPRWHRLETSGLVERCKPSPGGASNMLRITKAGQAALEAHRAGRAA